MTEQSWCADPGKAASDLHAPPHPSCLWFWDPREPSLLTQSWAFPEGVKVFSHTWGEWREGVNSLSELCSPERGRKANAPRPDPVLC